MLRPVVVDRAPRPSSRPAKTRARRMGAALAVAGAIGLGGCSADFLRFDAPVFNFDEEARVGVGTTASPDAGGYSGGGSLGDARTAGYAATSDVSRGDLAPVTRAPRDDRDWSRPARSASVPSATLAPDKGPASQPIASTPLATGALGRAETVTVQPGDTLYQLSRRHGVSVAALRSVNNLTGNIIHPGQKLALPSGNALPLQQPQRVGEVPRRMPAATVATPTRPLAGGRSVTVAPGDSLYAISRRTGVSVADLMRLNGIADARRLQPGTVLVLEGTGAPSRVAERRDYGQRGGGTARFPTAGPTNGPAASTGGQTGLIPTRPIRTVAIGRDMAGPVASAPANPNAPRILNGADNAASPERAPVAAVTSPTAPIEDDAPGATKFRWPAKGRIIATFNQSDRGVRNDGINISLPIGTPIHAVEDGTVAYAGSELKGYGNLVLLRHANGWVSAYAHASELLVARGDKVTRGQVIAKAGRSGGVTQPQLHFELRREAKPVDPLPHMAAM